MKRSMLVLLVAAAVTLGLTTSVRAQQGVTPGAPCSPEGATGTTADGTQMSCVRAAGEDQPRWRAASTQATQPPVATTTPAVTTTLPAATATTVAEGMPRTGSASGGGAALGFGVVLLGVVAVWWGRPRLQALWAGPDVIEQERIDKASTLLGWSDPWEHHLDKPYWLRRGDEDHAP